MKYKQFEELPLWIQSRKLVRLIYAHCNRAAFKNDYGLIDQMRRAAVSVMLNISEGFGRRSNKEFARFINQAKASANEVRCGLYIAIDLNYLTQNEFDILFREVTSIANQLFKFEKYLLNTHKIIS